MCDIVKTPGSSADALLAALAAVYSKRGESSTWDEESGIYAEALPKLVDQLKGTYVLVRPINLGSTATVWELNDTRLNQRRALKLPRPRLSRLKSIVRVFRGERDKLATLNHQNIVKIYTADELAFSVGSEAYSFPYFVMEFLDDVKDLSDFITDRALSCTWRDLVDYFRNILAGLDYLHRQGIVHCDIKPQNILIAPKRPALITDFGYAKHFPRPGSQTEMTEVTFTLKYGHPDLQARIKSSSDANATVAEIRKHELREQFDLYALGKTLLEVLRVYAQDRDSEDDGSSAAPLTPYQRQFVTIVAKRLLDGCVREVADKDLESDLIHGFSKPAMAEIKYTTPRQALEDLDKLVGLYNIEGDVPELNPNIPRYIQIPHCRVPLTSRVEAVINHPTFTRLAQITQLGFASFLYPGAAHTRYEHVLGTFSHCCEYVRALWSDQSNPLFQCIMNQHDLDVLLAAALLHDVGQYPMGHDLTEISSEFVHEAFGPQLLEVCPAGAKESLADLVLGKWGVSPDELTDVWFAHPKSSFKCRLLKSIISGPLDCDKTDYVRRDSTHLGVTFGAALDHERLLRNVTVAHKAEDGHHIPESMEFVGLGVAEKALVVAEGLVRSRQDMFTQVYWHHTVRCLKSMLGFAVRGTLMSLDGDKDKREQFWAAFHREVLWISRFDTNHEDAVEPTNEVSDTGNEDDWLGPDTTDVGHASGLSLSDDALLLFFRRFAPRREQGIIDAIRRRRLFGRVYVLTWAKEKPTYERIYSRFREYRLDGNLDGIEKWRKKCENRIREKVLEELPNVFRGQPERMAQIEQRISSADPLILIDVPVKGVSRSIAAESIWYIPEGRMEGQLVSDPVPLDEEPFDKAVGKIRLFGPADIRGALLRSLSGHHAVITESVLTS